MPALSKTRIEESNEAATTWRIVSIALLHRGLGGKSLEQPYAIDTEVPLSQTLPLLIKLTQSATSMMKNLSQNSSHHKQISTQNHVRKTTDTKLHKTTSPTNETSPNTGSKYSFTKISSNQKSKPQTTD